MIHTSEKPKVIVNNYAVGIPGLLFLLFVALRLTGHITWSWTWITAPLWIPVALFTLILGIMVAVAFIHAARVTKQERLKKQARKT